MKYSYTKIILILSIFLVSSPLVLNAKKIEVTNLKSLHEKVRNNEVTDYQFRIGEKIGSSFSNRCSSFIGVIDDFHDQKIDVIVQEQLWGDEVKEKKVQLNYIPPRQNSRYYGYSPWDYVEIQKGGKLFISSCGNNVGSQIYKIIVSKEELFPSIREVIAYNTRLEQNSSVLLEIPQLISTKDNFVFAGYVSLLLRGGSPNNKENAAIVLSQLLGERNVPPVVWAYARIAMRQLLVIKGEDALSPETHNLVIDRLVDIGSSNNKSAEQVIILFLEVAAQNNNLNIKPFLNENKRRGLLRNYQNYITKNNSQNGRKEFEKQLIKN